MVLATFWFDYIAAYKLWKYCFYTMALPTVLKVKPKKGSFVLFCFVSRCFSATKSALVPVCLEKLKLNIQEIIATK